jgi:hypothetical protein
MFHHLVHDARPGTIATMWDPLTPLHEVLPPKALEGAVTIASRLYAHLPWMYSLSVADQEWARYKAWAMRTRIITHCLDRQSRTLMLQIRDLHHQDQTASLLRHFAPLSDVYQASRPIRASTVLGVLPIEHLVIRNLGFTLGSFNVTVLTDIPHKLHMRTFFINRDVASIIDTLALPSPNPLFEIAHMRQSVDPSPLALHWLFDHLALLVAVEDVPEDTFLFIPKQSQS